MKSSLLVFLIVSTTFVDQSKISETRLTETTALFDVVAIIVILVPLLNVALVTLTQASYRPKITLLAEKHHLQSALQFRDVVMQLCLLPDEHFFKSVAQLGEIDLELLQATTRSLVSTFLGMQPAKRLFGQRLMPGVAFRSWHPAETMLETIARVADGSLQAAITKSARCRLALLKLATELRALRNHQIDDSHHGYSAMFHYPRSPVVSSSISEAAIAQAVTASEALRWHSRSAESLAESIADGSSLKDPVSCEEFSEFLASRTSLAESDIKLVYEYMTCSTTSTTPPALLNIMETLVAGAPRLNDELLDYLQKINLESGPCSVDFAKPVESEMSGDSSSSSAPDVSPDVARV